ncbi:unnamed protein product, partial [Orchesella dallaii]
MITKKLYQCYIFLSISFPIFTNVVGFTDSNFQQGLSDLQNKNCSLPQIKKWWKSHLSRVESNLPRVFPFCISKINGGSWPFELSNFDAILDDLERKNERVFQPEKHVLMSDPRKGDIITKLTPNKIRISGGDESPNELGNWRIFTLKMDLPIKGVIVQGITGLGLPGGEFSMDWRCHKQTSASIPDSASKYLESQHVIPCSFSPRSAYKIPNVYVLNAAGRFSFRTVTFKWRWIEAICHETALFQFLIIVTSKFSPTNYQVYLTPVMYIYPPLSAEDPGVSSPVYPLDIPQSEGNVDCTVSNNGAGVEMEWKYRIPPNIEYDNCITKGEGRGTGLMSFTCPPGPFKCDKIGWFGSKEKYLDKLAEWLEVLWGRDNWKDCCEVDADKLPPPTANTTTTTTTNTMKTTTTTTKPKNSTKNTTTTTTTTTSTTENPTTTTETTTSTTESPTTTTQATTTTTTPTTTSSTTTKMPTTTTKATTTTTTPPTTTSTTTKMPTTTTKATTTTSTPTTTTSTTTKPTTTTTLATTLPPLTTPLPLPTSVLPKNTVLLPKNTTTASIIIIPPKTNLTPLFPHHPPHHSPRSHLTTPQPGPIIRKLLQIESRSLETEVASKVTHGGLCILVWLVLIPIADHVARYYKDFPDILSIGLGFWLLAHVTLHLFSLIIVWFSFGLVVGTGENKLGNVSGLHFFLGSLATILQHGGFISALFLCGKLKESEAFKFVASHSLGGKGGYAVATLSVFLSDANGSVKWVCLGLFLVYAFTIGVAIYVEYRQGEILHIGLHRARCPVLQRIIMEGGAKPPMMKVKTVILVVMSGLLVFLYVYMESVH